MYFHNVVGTGSYTTSTTNMYNKDRFHVPAVVENAGGFQRTAQRAQGVLWGSASAVEQTCVGHLTSASVKSHDLIDGWFFHAFQITFADAFQIVGVGQFGHIQFCEAGA